jgi:tetratricopeptide (TPR) repeat protein
MAKWTAHPHAGDYTFDAASLKKSWASLHKGDCEPFPKDAAVLQAWIQFHNGEYQKAAEAGLKAGGDGITVANKATGMYATYLETKEKTKLEMFLEIAERAEAQQKTDPKNANAYYWQAYALGRYSQGISVAKALAQGLGSKVKQALEQAIRLSPKHADAHATLASFHAEVIDKVGSLIGGMTYGAKKDVGLNLYREALKLNPDSAVTLVEYANGMIMLEGEKKMKEATKLYEQAAACKPLDASERLDVEMAIAELAD